MPWVIFTQKEAGFISGIEDLNGKIVAVEKNYVMHKKLQSLYPDIILNVVDTSLDALQDLSVGEADAYIGNLVNSSFLIREYGLDNLKVSAPTPFGDHEQSMAVHKNWPELASIISKGIQAMTPAEHNDIKNKWLSIRYEHGVKYSEVALWFFSTVLIAFVIILTVVRVNRKLKYEIQSRLIAEKELLAEKESLNQALQEIQTLSGMLPICAQCKKIRDDDGYWNQLESYIENHSSAQFSHGMCDDCADKLYGGEEWYKDMKNEE